MADLRIRRIRRWAWGNPTGDYGYSVENHLWTTGNRQRLFVRPLYLAVARYLRSGSFAALVRCTP